jgi:hypothetical protein
VRVRPWGRVHDLSIGAALAQPALARQKTSIGTSGWLRPVLIGWLLVCRAVPLAGPDRVRAQDQVRRADARLAQDGGAPPLVWATAEAHLEHPVGVRRLDWDDLEYVPVLDDLAVVVEAEDVHSGVVVVAGPVLQAVQDD